MATPILTPIDAPAPLTCRCTSCDDALVYPSHDPHARCSACQVQATPATEQPAAPAAPASDRKLYDTFGNEARQIMIWSECDGTYTVQLAVDYGNVLTATTRHCKKQPTAYKYAADMLASAAYAVVSVFDPAIRRTRIYVEGKYHETVAPGFVADRLSHLRRFGPTLERRAA